MPARFNLYSAWTDTYFYVWAAVFAASLFLLAYSLKRFFGAGAAAPEGAAVPPEGETEANPFLEEPAAPAGEPSPAPQEEKTLVLTPGEQQAFLAAAGGPAGQPGPAAAQEPSAEAAAPQAEPLAAETSARAAPPAEPASGHAAAENFVRGIYAGIADLDERMKGIEAALSKGRVNGDFAVKFLEDMLLDMDNLDKAKIKARIEYLLSDLKK